MKKKKSVWNIRNWAGIMLGMALFGIGLFLFSFESAAAEVAPMARQNARVTGGAEINVRKSASTSSDRVTKAARGTEVVISGQATDEEGKVWYQVSFTANGSEVSGFIRSDYLELGDVIETPEGEGEAQAPEGDVPAENPEEQAPEPEQQAQQDPYTVVLETKEDGTVEWYLYDNDEGYKYPIPRLLEAANEEEDTASDGQLKQQKIIIIVMMAVIVLLVLGITLLILKVRDASAMDEEDDEDEDSGYEDLSVRRKRPAGEEQRPARRPAQDGQYQTRRPVQDGDRTARRPAQTGTGQQDRMKQGSRPVQRPVRAADGEPARRPVPQGERRSVQGTPKPKSTAPRPQEGQETDRKQEANGTRRSKNFLREDDEFEFEFLNMDDPNK